MANMRSRFDQYGREIPDSTPMALPAGFRRPETLQEQIQRLVRNEVSRRAAEEGMETFEEADDFEVEDDYIEPDTPYEEIFDPVLGKGLTPAEFSANVDRYRKEYMEAQERYYSQLELQEKLHGRSDAKPRGGGDAEKSTSKAGASESKSGNDGSGNTTSADAAEK